jgi:hypothetical protein
MPAVVPAASGQTPDSVTTTQVVNTDACNVGDTLVIVYATDAFDLATMPEATSSAGALTAGPVLDVGTNIGHIKTYTVVVGSPGVKTVTFPAHSGCDVHGHWVRYPESLALDVSATNFDATNSTSAHVAPSVDPSGVDRSLLCAWLTTNGPAMVGNPYVVPVGMTKQQESIASPFSDMCTATEELSADTPTGPRTATWLGARRYGAVTLALARLTVGGVVTFPLGLGSAATGVAQQRGGAVPFPLGLGLSAAGLRAGGAPVSDVLCGPWATPSDIPDAVKAELGLTDQQLLSPLMRASEILWMLAGRQWLGEGCIEDATLRSVAGQGTWPYHKTWGDCGCWAWADDLPSRLLFRDHIPMPVSVRLPRSPIGEILSVTVDGVLLASNEYALTRAGWLDRVGDVWDTCAGTTVVRYTFGEPPPAGGRDSAVALAVELAKDQYGLDGCRLPKRTTSVQRQGVSITMADPADFLEKGKTGIMSVDLWLSAVNPQARPRRGGVWSPDVPITNRRRTL